MPGARAKRYILHQLAITADQAVCRNPQLMDTGKIGVSLRVESSHKEIVDKGTAKLPRRQADAMHHQQGDIVRRGPFVVMGRRHPARLLAPASGIDRETRLRSELSHRLLELADKWRENEDT